MRSKSKSRNIITFRIEAGLAPFLKAEAGKKKKENPHGRGTRSAVINEAIRKLLAVRELQRKSIAQTQ